MVRAWIACYMPQQARCCGNRYYGARLSTFGCSPFRKNKSPGFYAGAMYLWIPAYSAGAVRVHGAALNYPARLIETTLFLLSAIGILSQYFAQSVINPLRFSIRAPRAYAASALSLS